MSVLWGNQVKRRVEPGMKLSPLWAFVGAVLSLAVLGYAFVYLWLRLPIR